MKKYLKREMTLPGLLRRNHLERTHFEVLFFVLWSGGLALAALVGVAWVAGFGRVGRFGRKVVITASLVCTICCAYGASASRG